MNDRKKEHSDLERQSETSLLIDGQRVFSDHGMLTVHGNRNAEAMEMWLSMKLRKMGESGAARKKFLKDVQMVLSNLEVVDDSDQRPVESMEVEDKSVNVLGRRLLATVYTHKRAQESRVLHDKYYVVYSGDGIFVLSASTDTTYLQGIICNGRAAIDRITPKHR